MSICADGGETSRLRRPSLQLPRGRSRLGKLAVGNWELGVWVALACLAFVVPLQAQEGHPLVGTWRGAWGPSAQQQNDVTFVMEYDGKTVTGVINPGFESMRLQKVTLDPAAWTVRFETETKDASGKGIPVVIDAKFEDITNRHRSLVGTWVQGTTKGQFRITLD
jgi:hypothetical protein